MQETCENYNPNWEDVRNTAKSISSLNEWKTQFLGIDRSDLFQESWFVFDKCVKRQNIYENKYHFLGFFNMAFKNKIIDMIKYKRIEKETTDCFCMETIEGDDVSENVFQSKESSDFVTKFREAPDYIKDTIELLKNYPKMCKISRISNKKLCAMLGYDPNNINLIEEIKKYFKKGE